LFHQLSDNEKYNFYNNLKPSRLKKLAGRIIFRNFEDLKNFPEPIKKEYNEYRTKLKSSLESNCIKGFKNDTKFTIEDYQKQLNALNRHKLDQKQLKILDSLNFHIQNF